jgi:hypothetical protein
MWLSLRRDRSASGRRIAEALCHCAVAREAGTRGMNAGRGPIAHDVASSHEEIDDAHP